MSKKRKTLHDLVDEAKQTQSEKRLDAEIARSLTLTNDVETFRFATTRIGDLANSLVGASSLKTEDLMGIVTRDRLVFFPEMSLSSVYCNLVTLPVDLFDRGAQVHGDDPVPFLVKTSLLVSTIRALSHCDWVILQGRSCSLSVHGVTSETAREKVVRHTIHYLDCDESAAESTLGAMERVIRDGMASGAPVFVSSKEFAASLKQFVQLSDTVCLTVVLESKRLTLSGAGDMRSIDDAVVFRSDDDEEEDGTFPHLFATRFLQCVAESAHLAPTLAIYGRAGTAQGFVLFEYELACAGKSVFVVVEKLD